MKKNSYYFGLLLLSILTINCSSGNKTTSANKTTMTTTPTGGPYSGTELDKYCSNPKRLLVIETKLGTMKIQLFDKIAPKHVEQITRLASEKFYDGCTFHRVMRGFMIQGGDPNSKDDDLSNDGTGGADKTIPAEFSSLHHSRGIASMARSSSPNSASSQFFICHGDAGFLDKQYTIWGQLVEGYDVLDKIVDLDKDPKYKKSGEGSINPGKDAQMTKVWVQE
jgi:cyclophilin family peptidyl-prolyl cis-trans isomerase